MTHQRARESERAAHAACAPTPPRAARPRVRRPAARTADAPLLAPPAQLADRLTVADAQIYKGDKQTHLRKIAKNLGCRFADMIFFDDARDGKFGNCVRVAELGVDGGEGLGVEGAAEVARGLEGVLDR